MIKKWIKEILVVLGIITVASAATIGENLFAQADDLEFQITVDGAIRNDVLDAFATTYGRPEKISSGLEMIPNPLSKKDFMEDELYSFIRNVYEAYAIKEVTKSALEDARENSRSKSSILKRRN